jgi:hypothetical protein
VVAGSRVAQPIARDSPEAALDAAAALWTIRKRGWPPEAERHCDRCAYCTSPGGAPARAGPKAERGAGSAATAPCNGAALDLVRLNSATVGRGV